MSKKKTKRKTIEPTRIPPMSKNNKKKKIVYTLYATRTTDELVDSVSSMRFVRVTPDYTLIYTEDGKIIQNKVAGIKYTIIRDRDVSRLSKADRDWLMNCNFTIIAEETMKNQELILQNMNDALDVLEKELEKNRNTEENK